MIQIYYSPKCKGCRKAIDFFDDKNIPYEALDLSAKENRDARSEFRKLGVDTLPVIKGVTIDGMESILYGWKESHKDILIKNNENTLSKEDEKLIEERLRQLGYIE